MAQCRKCNKKGLFLSLSSCGLCRDCQALVDLEVQQRVRVIKSSADVADRSKKLETRLSRLSVMREHLEALLEYERMDIPTTTPPPSSLLAKLRDDRDRIVVEGVREKVDSALAKAEVAATARTAITQASKGLLAVTEGEKELDDPSQLCPLREKVQEFIHKTTLDSHLEAARKAEFKGQEKKALDAYQEALYFLRTDAIDDSQQAEEIAGLEEKIRKLQDQLG